MTNSNREREIEGNGNVSINIQPKLKFYISGEKKKENQFSDNYYPGRFIIFY